MNNWQKLRIGDFANTYAGGTPARGNQLFFGGNIPWVKSTEVNQGKIFNTEETITETGLSSSSAKWIPANTVLVALYGATAAQIGFLKFKATSNQAVLAIIPTSQIDSYYLYYSLLSAKEKLLFLAQGSGQPNLNKQIVDNLKLDIPPLPQQRKIAKILTTVDNLIEKTEQLIAKYQSIKQGMMHDLFTRGIDAEGKLRPPQSEGMSEELAGTIPVGWQQKALNDFFTVSSGEGLSQAKMCAGQYPVYGGNGITGFHDRYLYQEKRLIIGRVGEYCGNVYITQPQSWITDNALIATFFEKSAYMPFWFYILNQLKLNDFAFAAAQPVITGGILKRIKILLPPLPQQRKIAEILSKQDQLIEDHEKELMKYKQLKTALMQDLLTGEVQVTPDEIDKELAHA